MRKLISVLSVMLILFASVWAMMPVMAAALPVVPENGTQDVGGCAVHTFGGWSAATTTDCTTDGYVTRSCLNCGFVEVEKAADHYGHAAANYEFNAEAATHSYTCLYCAEQITEACTLVLESADLKCATLVKNTYRCTVCNNTLEREEAPSHNVAEWTLVDGSVQHSGVCADCNETVYEACEMVEVTVNADCLNGGVRIMQCECGRVSHENIPAQGHNVETWLHIENTEIHAGKCTRCLASLNVNCTLGGFKADEVVVGSTVLTHTGACTVCLAEYTKECTPGEYNAVAGTSSHQTSCVDCGRNYTGFCIPDDKGWTPGTNGSHSATCVVCKSVFTEACTPTAYTHVEGTETHSTACSVCKGEYATACSFKTWAAVTKTNETTGLPEDTDTHAGICEVCNEEYTKNCAAESYKLNVEDEICIGTCSVCGDAMTHESNLSDWTFDSEKNTHTVECTICKATASHTVTLGEWKHTETNGNHEHEANCTICNTPIDGACTFEGNKDNLHLQICKVCAYSYETECVNLVKDKTNSKPATCTEDGFTYYTCEDCGKEKVNTLTHKATGHDLKADADSEIEKTAEGHTVTKACQNEGCAYIETATDAHEFGKAKAGENGEHIYTCSVCGYEKTEKCKAVKIPAVAATCTKGGKTEGSKCSVCEAVLKEQTSTDAKGHDFKYTSTTATCSAAGKDIFKCVCGETKEVDAAANGKHEWKVSNRVAATAEANGYVEYKCKNCTETYREVLVYSVNTGLSSAMTPIAAIVLLSGTAFLGVKKLRKDEE